MELTTPIYMDAHATTLWMNVYWKQCFPIFETNSERLQRSHIFGWTAEAAVDKARERIAALIGGQPKEIIFTSGATESDNLAIKGVAAAHGDRGRHIITQATEHHAVLDTCRALARQASI